MTMILYSKTDVRMYVMYLFRRAVYEEAAPRERGSYAPRERAGRVPRYSRLEGPPEESPPHYYQEKGAPEVREGHHKSVSQLLIHIYLILAKIFCLQ